MSLNPVLVKFDNNGILMPQLRRGEDHILTRPNVNIKLITPTETLKGKGYIVITNQRIVFVKFKNRNFRKRYSSISLPFLLMSRPLFQQPVLTPNYFQINILPDTVESSPFSGEGQFNIYFFKGGSNLFLHHFYILYARNKNNPNRFIPHNDNSASILCDSSVLVDPSDLTKIYLTQPDTSPVVEDTTSTQTNNATNNESLNRLGDYDTETPFAVIIYDAMRKSRILSKFLPRRLRR